MKKSLPFILAIGILLLFVIQSAGTLVESIYILDLLNTSLDEKVLGLLFFFAPLLLLPFFRRAARPLGWVLFAVLFVARGLIPYLPTAGRFLAAGLATAAAFGLFLLLLAARPRAESTPGGGAWAAGLALAVTLSVLLRAAGDGIEYSLTPAGGWTGWLLGALLGLALTRVDWTPRAAAEKRGKPVTLPLLGLYLVITLVYFAFSAPAVIARWTQGSYTLVTAAVGLLAAGYVWIAAFRPVLVERLSPRWLLAWNLLFTLSLTGVLLANRVPFPPSLQSPAVVVGAPAPWQHLLTALMLLLFPVIFVDFDVFFRHIRQAAPTPGQLAPGSLLGGLALIVLVFMHIFTNVWGYVPPVSTLFRNLFWLPYFLLAAGISLLAWLSVRRQAAIHAEAQPGSALAGSLVLAALCLGTVVFALPARLTPPDGARKTSFRVMTINAQQFNDASGEKSFERQLALVRGVSPDILAMQETDSARISFNNNDYLHALAEKLGYYSYYGPTPVTGTYGTAILSKYPLENPRAAFMFSDKDETGVAEAEVVIGGHRITVYDVHPDSSDPAMVNFARTLLERAAGKPDVIALGDYNLRDYEEAYQVIDRVLVNAWTSVYPSKISPDGVDMSGKNRIDHIFTTVDLKAVDPVYVLPPASATDHPVHWTDLVFKAP